MSASPASFYFVVPVNQLSPAMLGNSAFGIAIIQGMGPITLAQATTAWNNVNTFLTGLYGQLAITISAQDLIYMTNIMIVLFSKVFTFHSGAFQ